MLTIVEEHETFLSSLPDLGIAYLLGACKSESVKTHLISGSIRFLKDILCDSRELISFLNNDSLYRDTLPFKQIHQELMQKGELELREYLKEMYAFSRADSISDYLNSSKYLELKRLLSNIQHIYDFNTKQGVQTSLSQNLIDKIKKTKPDLAALSVYYFDSALMKQVVNMLRQEEIPVVLGGSFTAYYSPEMIFRNYDADFVIPGSADFKLVNLCKNLPDGKDVEGVFRREGGRIIGKPARQISFDSLPNPDFSKFDLDAFFSPVRVLPIFSGRGCYWGKCAFCNYHLRSNSYEAKPILDVADLIQEYKEKYRARLVMFSDDCISPTRLVELSDEIIKRGLNDLNYFAYVRAEFFSRPIFKKIRQAGFSTLAYGVESGSQNVLDSMRKGIESSKTAEILKNAYDAGIANFVFLLFGFPGETREDRDKTIKFLETSKEHIDCTGSSTFYIAKHSPTYESPAEWGLYDVKGPMDFKITSEQDRDELLSFIKQFNNRLDADEFRNSRYLYAKGPAYRNLIFIQSSFEKIFFTNVEDVLNKEGAVFPVFSGSRQGKENQELYNLLDGKKTVHEVMSLTGLKKDELLKKFNELNKIGKIHFFKKMFS